MTKHGSRFAAMMAATWLVLAASAVQAGVFDG